MSSLNFAWITEVCPDLWTMGFSSGHEIEIDHEEILNRSDAAKSWSTDV